MIETIASHLDSFVALAPTWGFVLVFVFMTIESSFIPFPSEVVMIPAGFLAARGEFGAIFPILALWLSIVIGIIGSIVGAFINYYLALFFGMPFLKKFGKYFFIKPEPLQKACEIFNKYGAATTFICRLVPVIRQLISIPAGCSKMRLLPFTFFTTLGAGIWTAILAFIGYFIGKGSKELTYLELVTKGKEIATSHLPLVLGSAILLVVFYFGITRLIVKRKK